MAQRGLGVCQARLISHQELGHRIDLGVAEGPLELVAVLALQIHVTQQQGAGGNALPVHVGELIHAALGVGCRVQPEPLRDGSLKQLGAVVKVAVEVDQALRLDALELVFRCLGQDRVAHGRRRGAELERGLGVNLGQALAVAVHQRADGRRDLLAGDLALFGSLQHPGQPGAGLDLKVAGQLKRTRLAHSLVVDAAALPHPQLRCVALLGGLQLLRRDWVVGHVLVAGLLGGRPGDAKQLLAQAVQGLRHRLLIADRGPGSNVVDRRGVDLGRDGSGNPRKLDATRLKER